MSNTPSYRLVDGARIAVIGGGPAGAFFAYFALTMAAQAGRKIEVDIYEPRDFFQPGPGGCNMCAGIVSEKLGEMLAAEGITLPSAVVRQGIGSYVLHMDVGSARIETPRAGKRISAVYRGAGPRDSSNVNQLGLDGHLLSLALERGAAWINERVSELAWRDGRPQIQTRSGMAQAYDLLVVTAGVNSAALKLFEEMGLPYQAPETTKTYLREYYVGQEKVHQLLGDAIQIFLLQIPGLEFGMLIPKREYITVCLLGEEIDKDLAQAFLDAPEVQACLPAGLNTARFSCQCSPRINIRAAQHPYADRIVFVGDCSATRLYKDGVGSAYRTAKVAASTAIFHGVSGEDFERHYRPALEAIEADNDIGRLILRVISLVRNQRFARKAMLRMVLREQDKPSQRRHMSTVQWDMYTGSGTYKQILLRMLHPAFLLRLGYESLISLLPEKTGRQATVPSHGDGLGTLTDALGEV